MKNHPRILPSEGGHGRISSFKNFHFGLMEEISTSFLFLVQPFISFSLEMAALYICKFFPIDQIEAIVMTSESFRIPSVQIMFY
jgi:hypothetical protein